ncbi:MAG TPA: histidine phosphatase family protein [Actinomycetes bacterium]|nr:histidine phosphatase family protein [Actinomycetes bacterium]
MVDDMLLVVRHADAGDKRGWEGPDGLRPLSPVGRCQAEGLLVRLEDYPVERILCSPAVRCRQTVEPLARNRHLRIEPSAVLDVDADAAGVLETFWDGAVADAVLCTHGETIGRLLEQLTTGGSVLEAPPHWPKGSTWLLQRNGRRRVHARYLPPLALDPRTCPPRSHLPTPGGRPGGDRPVGTALRGFTSCG